MYLKTFYNGKLTIIMYRSGHDHLKYIDLICMHFDRLGGKRIISNLNSKYDIVLKHEF